MLNDLRRTGSRRADDFLTHTAAQGETSADANQLPKIALGWLKELVHREFASAPIFNAEQFEPGPSSALGGSDEVDASIWQREWRRRWRRFQLPDRLSAFSDAMGRARTAAEVYSLLSEYAVHVVGAFTCLLFLPQPGSAMLRPLPNAKLPGGADRLHIRRAPLYAGLIDTVTATRDSKGQFGGLAPLFDEGGAVCLACAPFSGGALVLVERRAERAFEAEDWHLLRALSIQAEAALERTRLLDRVRGLAQVDSATGLTSNGQAKLILEHAWQSARRGEPLIVVYITLQPVPLGTGLADDDHLSAVAEALRQESGGSGVTIRHDDAEFLLVLPQADTALAEAIIERVHQRVLGKVKISTGLAQYHPAMETPDHLVQAAQRSVRGVGPEPELCLEV